MRVQKIWQNQFFVTQFGPLNFWHEEFQEYNPWLEILFIENSKQNKNMLMIQLATMTGGNRSKLDIQKESTKQMIEWTFLKIEISKQNAEWKRHDIFTILSFR